MVIRTSWGYECRPPRSRKSRWECQADSINNSYNPLLSFSTWFPGAEGIVAHHEGKWKDRAWAESHPQADMIQYKILLIERGLLVASRIETTNEGTCPIKTLSALVCIHHDCPGETVLLSSVPAHCHSVCPRRDPSTLPHFSSLD